MTYIRIKDVTKKNGKKYTYAYLVQTTWRKRKHPKQKSLKYLGKIYSFNQEQNIHHCINHHLEKEHLFRDLLKIELLNHGFEEKKKSIFHKENCIVDLSRFLFYDKNGKETVLQINSGFLCHHSVHQLLHYTITNDKKGQKHFAKTLALTGIHLHPEEFVDLYEYMNNERI